MSPIRKDTDSGIKIPGLSRLLPMSSLMSHLFPTNPSPVLLLHPILRTKLQYNFQSLHHLLTMKKMRLIMFHRRTALLLQRNSLVPPLHLPLHYLPKDRHRHLHPLSLRNILLLMVGNPVRIAVIRTLSILLKVTIIPVIRLFHKACQGNHVWFLRTFLTNRNDFNLRERTTSKAHSLLLS